MSIIYNRALRSGDEGKAGKWANTMLVAVSGIVKLSAVSAPAPSGKLFRVLSNNNNNNNNTRCENRNREDPRVQKNYRCLQDAVMVFFCFERMPREVLPDCFGPQGHQPRL